MSKFNAPIIINNSSPVSTSDSAHDFHIGYRWLDTVTNSEYICVNDTNNAAVWNTVGSGSSSGTSGQGVTTSFIDWYVLNATTAPVALSGSYTVGTQFIPLKQIRITGIRFYWANATLKTVACKLWDDTSSALRSANVIVNGVGYYYATFSSYYEVPDNKINYRHYVSTWENSGTYYTTTYASYSAHGIDYPNLGIICDSGIMYTSSGYWFSGDNRPTTLTGSERYMSEPVIDTTVFSYFNDYRVP
jgi:hypothetical protein